MTVPSRVRIGGLLALLVVVVGVLVVGVPRWAGRSTAPAAVPASVASPTEPERKIQARLFYVSEDGHSLIGVERDVPYGADPSAQARAILDAQIAAPEAPLVSAIPTGTTVRAVFVAGSDAYVDLTPDIVRAHPGGSLNEQLTVHTLVSAVTANLPAITRVQILVDGKEVDTLSGHVDLREPIAPSPEWVR
jgi:Sporulation and spore germination